jgi:cell division protein FtsQ
VRRIASHRRLLAVPLVAAVVLAGGFLLLRDSSLVRVKHVDVAGATGPEAARVRSALIRAGRDMTTLHVRESALREAVAGFPTVKDVRVDRELPDTLAITVVGRPAVAALSSGGQRLPVAADDTLLRGSPVPGDVPVLRVGATPAGSRLAEPRALRALALVAAAPTAMREHVERAYLGDQGLEAQLRDGPTVIAGEARRLRAKWVAAARVLGDKGARGARYVDVRVPERAVAGGLPTEGQPSTEG